MAAAEFHSPPRSLAESYAQDLILQHQQQQQPQAGPPLHLHSSVILDRERERDRDREHLSPGMESVLGRMPVMTPLPGASGSAGVGAISGATSLEGVAPVEHFLGPKRKRGRPPLDDSYDVFNVYVVF